MADARYRAVNSAHYHKPGMRSNFRGRNPSMTPCKTLAAAAASPTSDGTTNSHADHIQHDVHMTAMVGVGSERLPVSESPQQVNLLDLLGQVPALEFRGRSLPPSRSFRSQPNAAYGGPSGCGAGAVSNAVAHINDDRRAGRREHHIAATTAGAMLVDLGRRGVYLAPIPVLDLAAFAIFKDR